MINRFTIAILQMSKVKLIGYIGQGHRTSQGQSQNLNLSTLELVPAFYYRWSWMYNGSP